MYRTHDCNSLRKIDIGKQVTLAGWVNVSRDHGGVIFIDLRDREGLTQVVFRPEENAEVAKEAHRLHSEDVIQVTGKVRPTDSRQPFGYRDPFNGLQRCTSRWGHRGPSVLLDRYRIFIHYYE